MLSESPAAEVPAITAEAEAARYALLRRLAPSMRHHLVVNLQPIGMIYEVLERRLRAPQPDLAGVHDSAHKINGFARAALASCLDVVGWLAPDSTVATGVDEGVRECTALLATSLSFRGYALRNESESVPGQVRRASLRAMLTGALLYATDHLQPPGELVLTVEDEPEGARILLRAKPTQGERGFPAEAGYRAMEWKDLQALAAAEGVQLIHTESAIRITLPWMAS